MLNSLIGRCRQVIEVDGGTTDDGQPSYWTLGVAVIHGNLAQLSCWFLLIVSWSSLPHTSSYPLQLSSFVLLQSFSSLSIIFPSCVSSHITPFISLYFLSLLGVYSLLLIVSFIPLLIFLVVLPVPTFSSFPLPALVDGDPQVTSLLICVTSSVLLPSASSFLASALQRSHFFLPGSQCLHLLLAHKMESIYFISLCFYFHKFINGMGPNSEREYIPRFFLSFA